MDPDRVLRLIDFINKELDNGSNEDKKAVAAMTVDLAKAFNRLDHCKLVTLLFDMGVPPCPLKLLISYLSGRTMEVHLDDAVSEIFELWGGGPQGGLLTVLLFNINSNFITDLCQPGIRQSARFGNVGPIVKPRCS